MPNPPLDPQGNPRPDIREAPTFDLPGKGFIELAEAALRSVRSEQRAQAVAIEACIWWAEAQGCPRETIRLAHEGLDRLKANLSP